MSIFAGLTQEQHAELMALCQQLRGLPLTSGGHAPAKNAEGQNYPLISKKLTAAQHAELMALCKQLRDLPLTKAMESDYGD